MKLYLLLICLLCTLPPMELSQNSLKMRQLFNGVTTCKKVVGRYEWQANRPTASLKEIGKPTLFALSYSYLQSHCSNVEECGELLKTNQRFDQVYFALSDTRYNYCFDDNGNIYKGTGWTTGNFLPVGSQVIQLCLLGDFSKKPAKEETLRNLLIFLDCHRANGFIARDYSLMVRPIEEFMGLMTLKQSMEDVIEKFPKIYYDTLCTNMESAAHFMKKPNTTINPVSHVNTTYATYTTKATNNN